MTDDMWDTETFDYDQPIVLADDETERLEQVNRHMRWAAHHERMMADELANFDAEIKRLVARRQILKANRERSIAWHAGHVESYHRAILERDGDRAPRTLHLPYGDSVLRVPKKRRIEWADDDHAAVLEWVKANHPDHLKIDLQISAVRSIGTPTADGNVVDPLTGELIPGVHAPVPEPTWNLTTEGNPQ